MTKLEKVIKGIFEMLQRNTWKDIDDKRHKFQTVLNDALELLKEQEAYEWHFIKFREATDEEKEHYKEEYGEYNEGDADSLQMMENVPADGEEVLLWTWCGFTVDTYDDGMFENAGEIEKGMAWRYLPEIPKAGEQE